MHNSPVVLVRQLNTTFSVFVVSLSNVSVYYAAKEEVIFIYVTEVAIFICFNNTSLNRQMKAQALRLISIENWDVVNAADILVSMWYDRREQEAAHNGMCLPIGGWYSSILCVTFFIFVILV